MAQKVEVIYECDLEAAKHDGEIETVTFMVNDGVTREMELCGLHRKQFDKATDPFITSARKVTSARVTQFRPRTRTARSDNAAVRAWAKDNGKMVSDRGRIPEAIFSEYAASH